MPKKPKVKGKEEGERVTKAGGGKPIKVVTFDTPETEHPGQTESSSWGARAGGDIDKVVENQEPFSGSAAWGENAAAADEGGWDQPVTDWTSPTPEPLPVPPPVPLDVRSPPPSSPPPPRPLSAVPDTATATKESRKRMSGSVAGETHDEYTSWGGHQDTTDLNRWGSPLSHTATPIGLASPPVEPQSLAAAAAAVQTMKTNSASEAARKLARPSAVPQPPLAAPAPPPPTSAQTRTAPPNSQQWGEWSKSTPTSQPGTRYGNREDFALASAAIEKELRKAAAVAGHYNPERGRATQNSRWGQQSDHGWDSAKGSAWSQQGKGHGGAWDQAGGSEAWGSHRGSDTGWGGASRSKKSDRGWGHGSDAGYSQNSRSVHRGRQPQAQPQAQPSKHHKAKSWEAWGRKHSEVETESEDNEDENEGWEEEEDGYDGGWGQSEQDHGWGGNGESSSWGKDTSGWNKSGDTGWGTSGGNDGGGGGWDQPQNGTEWGTSHHQSAWGESKVITDPPENVGTRNVLSPQQRSQILNSLLNLPQGQKSGGDLRRHGAGKKHKSEPSNGWSQHDGWGNDTGWGPITEEEEKSESEGSHAHTSSKKPDFWNTSINDSSYTMPSKTLAYAYKDTTTSLHMGKPRNSMHDYTSVQFVESQGAALKPVHHALFGKARWAKDRIHWMFPPDKDERVSMLLAWIESMSYNLGTFGLHKFLQSRERGALITNADFRLPQFPGQPVFDWLTFDQLQGTMDKIMQESVVFYEPATQVIVFVLLPSKSGNSVAMWRRKIKVPNNTRLMYQEHIKQALAGLKKEKDHVVYVDRLPLKPENSSTPRPRSPAGVRLAPKVPSKLTKAALAPAPKKKRKWWQIFKSS